MAFVPSPVMERIRTRAQEAYPEECCGFLTGVRGSREVVGTPEGRGTPEARRAREGREGAEANGTNATTVQILEALPTRNIADEPDRTTEFLVEPKAVLEVMKAYRGRDEDLVGFYHSHPDHDAGLSPTDLEFARLWPRTVWLVVSVEQGVAGGERAWWLRGMEAVRDEEPSSESSTTARSENQPQEMIIRSSAPAGGAVTPREETV